MKRFSWVALFLMVAVLLAACSQSSGKPQTESQTNTGTPSTDVSEGKQDTSKKVELEWYLLGDASKDQKQVVDEWNKMLEKDLNTTVKLNFTTWTDWQTKYNLLLASGEKIDMIFAFSWADYYKLANQGAFLPLGDLLPAYAPETWKNVPKQDWDEATVKGSIYAVPATYPEYTPDGLVYRDRLEEGISAAGNKGFGFDRGVSRRSQESETHYADQRKGLQRSFHSVQSLQRLSADRRRQRSDRSVSLRQAAGHYRLSVHTGVRSMGEADENLVR